MVDLASIQQKIISFRNERDWAQFHDPKNLAEALSIEAGELLQNFLWKTTEQSRNLSPDLPRYKLLSVMGRTQERSPRSCMPCRRTVLFGD